MSHFVLPTTSSLLLHVQQPWVLQLMARHKDTKMVFSADGYAADRDHLSTGLSQDHLVSSLHQHGLGWDAR